MRLHYKLLFILNIIFSSSAIAETIPQIIPRPPEQTTQPTNVTTTNIVTAPASAPAAPTTTIVTTPQPGSTVTTTANPISSVTDAELTDKAKRALANSRMLDGTTIVVTTTNGIVTLEGTTLTQIQADEAYEIVRTIYGVREVRSNITVRPAPTTAPTIVTTTPATPAAPTTTTTTP